MSAHRAGQDLQGKILVVDDEADMIYTCTRMIEDLPVTISTAPNGEAALKLLAESHFDLALIDVVMPGMDGLALLRKIKTATPTSQMEIIMLTGFPTVETALQAVEEGASDYLTKPFSPEQLQISVKKALAIQRFKRENLRLRTLVKDYAKAPPIVGSSPALQSSLDLIKKAAGDPCNVLIIGETGTGKELTARAIHALGNKRDMPFVPVDCGALSETLLESELFGHEKGAFTGAHSQRIGILEYANDGTVFLDDISEMSSRLQIALLRFLQERQLRRVGSNLYVDANVRVIAAVNVNLTELIQEGHFRQDLYFRLNVLSILLPPLRQRKEDIPALSDVFLREFATQRRKSIPTIDPDAMESLFAYRWPGNIRELRNIIERAVLLCDADEITLDLLPEDVRTADVGAAEAHSDFRRAKADAVLSFERAYLDVLLKKTLGNVRQSARVAGMPRSSLQRLLRKHKINSGSFRNPLKGEGRETRS